MAKNRTSPEFEVDFMSPQFALRVGGKTRKECEQTFFTVFERVARQTPKGDEGMDVMHR